MCCFLLQVTLYTMMLASRYGNNVPGGLLCYLKAGHTQGLPSLPHEKRGGWSQLINSYKRSITVYVSISLFPQVFS